MLLRNNRVSSIFLLRKRFFWPFIFFYEFGGFVLRFALFFLQFCFFLRSIKHHVEGNVKNRKQKAQNVYIVSDYSKEAI